MISKIHRKSKSFYTPFEIFQYKPIETLKQKLLMEKRFGNQLRKIYQQKREMK